VKISINRELIVNAAELLWTCKPLDVESARRILLDILEDNPAPITKQLTPEETVEFLIEITDTLAAYLWNKKEEVTTHQYAKYLDELREKLEEYNS
jgi:hypothetical protein